MQLAGDWRTLRRAFKKMDVSSDGMLTLPEFRSVLKLCNGKRSSEYFKEDGGRVGHSIQEY